MSVNNLQHPTTITLPPVSPAGATYSISAAGPLTTTLGTTTGTSGMVLTSTGGSINYTNTMVGSSVWSNPSWTTPAPSNLQVGGDADIKGKLVVGGKDIGELIDKIEQRLAILHVNVELEDKWKDLKSLGDQYRELEKEIIEKEKMWEILNR
jgi:hypothetical protein